MHHQDKIPYKQVSDIFSGTPKKFTTSHRNIYLATFSAQLFIMVMGMVSCYSSPAVEDLVRPGSRFMHTITPDQTTWIASLPNLSGVFGNVLSGYLSHQFGRKFVLMCVSTSFATSWLLIAYAPTISFIYAGRLLSGLSAGISSVAVPAYVVEISTVDIRGRLTAGSQVAFSVGAFIMTGFGIFLRWSWLAIVGSVFVAIGVCLLYFMPESPPWLIRKSRNDEALRGIIFLKGKDHDASREFVEISNHIAQEPKDGLTFRELLKPSLYKPLLIAFGLMFNQSFCGFPAIMSYTVGIFEESGNSINSYVAATIVVLIQMIATSASSLLMDKAGRKVLYTISGSSMTLTLTVLGIYTYFAQNHDVKNLSWVPLVCLMIYIGTFSLGFGPIPYVVIPELVPTHSRSFVMAVGCASASFLGFVVIKTFKNMQTALGLYGLFWFYGFITFAGFIIYWIFVPETKGLSVHDINRKFSGSVPEKN